MPCGGWTPERPNLLCVAELAVEKGLPTYAVDLSTTLWPYFDLGGRQNESRRTHTLARTAANELGDCTQAEGIVVRALGIHELRQERYAQAETLLREALALHADDPALQNTTMTYLTTITGASIDGDGDNR